MPFSFEPQQIPGLVLVQPAVFDDGRGFFMEWYKRADFAAAGIEERFVQANLSRSGRGVLRGLHYQKAPQAQGKLVSVLAGEVYDVAVDIRQGSPTYGRWAGFSLSAANRRMLYVPPGFAHGFLVLSDTADFFYQMTAEYAPQLDRGVRWDDPTIGVDWPLEGQPLLSDKDRVLPALETADNDFRFYP